MASGMTPSPVPHRHLLDVLQLVHSWYFMAHAGHGLFLFLGWWSSHRSQTSSRRRPSCSVGPGLTIAICTPNLFALNVNLKGILTLFNIPAFWAEKKPINIIDHWPSMAPVSKSQRSVASWTVSRRLPWSPAPRWYGFFPQKGHVFRWKVQLRNQELVPFGIMCEAPSWQLDVGGSWTMALKSSINHIKHGEG